MCLNITGSRNEKLFKVSFTHTRLFLPEELGFVLNANDYAMQKQKDHALQLEAEEAKEYGLSLEEFRSQKEYLEKANRDKEQKQSHNQQTGMELEEEGSSAGVGNITNKRNENELTESMMHIQTGQPLSNQKRQEEERAYEAAKQHNQHDDHDRSSFEVIKGGEVSNVDDNYLHVGSYYAAPQDSDNHQFHAIGSMVCVDVQKGEPLYGVIQWVGTIPGITRAIAGVELVSDNEKYAYLIYRT